MSYPLLLLLFTKLASQLVNRLGCLGNSVREHSTIQHLPSHNMDHHTTPQVLCSQCLQSNSKASLTLIKALPHPLEGHGVNQLLLKRKKSRRRKSQKPSNTLKQIRPKRKGQWSPILAAQMMSPLFTSQRQGSRKTRRNRQIRRSKKHQSRHPLLIFLTWGAVLHQSQRLRKSRISRSIS